MASPTRWVWASPAQLVMDREAWRASAHGVAESQTQREPRNWTKSTNETESWVCIRWLHLKFVLHQLCFKIYPINAWQVLGPGALGKPRGSGWRGRWEGGSGWGTQVNPWLFHFNVWQNPLQKKKIYPIKQNQSAWGRKPVNRLWGCGGAGFYLINSLGDCYR